MRDLGALARRLQVRFFTRTDIDHGRENVSPRRGLHGGEAHFHRDLTPVPMPGK